jgi:hypothetical protein
MRFTIGDALQFSRNAMCRLVAGRSCGLPIRPYGADAADAGGSGGLLRGNGTLPPTDTPTLPPPIGTPMPTPTPIDSQAASSVAAQSESMSMRFIDKS